VGIKISNPKNRCGENKKIENRRAEIKNEFGEKNSFVQFGTAY
jgi:hypothetical protein